MTEYLTVADHYRTFQHFTYVYPVVSRRAGGVSIGINLNTNNACNWRCIYCQVPDLKRGAAPTTNLTQLAQELNALLNEILHGDFMQTHVDESHRTLQDIAFSGNGEPTSSDQFYEAVALVKQTLVGFNLLHRVKVRLITNGSLMHQPSVIAAIQLLATINGEVWFKFDAGTAEDIQRINNVNVAPSQHLARLKQCATYCPTYIQSCMFAYQQQAPSQAQLDAYFEGVMAVKSWIKGVMLYGVARPSHQPEAKDISPLPLAALEAIAEKLRLQGIAVSVFE